uniref:50S ribosomal protein L9, chloroplastic n=1 Tax=Alexandrium andersonii TaxID=327968 RepID=A0A7S2MNT2_9DINO
MVRATFVPVTVKPRRQSRPSGALILALLAAVALAALCTAADGDAFAVGRFRRMRKQKLSIILKKDYEFLGKAGEVFEVKRGYYRNFLLPKGIATINDDTAMKQLEAAKQAQREKMSKAVQEAMGIKEKIERGTYTFEKKLRPGGEKIYGSLSPTEVGEAITVKTGYPVRITSISVPRITELGDYAVTVELAEGVAAYLQVEVVAEGGDAPEEEEG